MKRPVIGISAIDDDKHWMYQQRTSYSDAIWENGGLSIYLPCRESLEDVEQVVSLCDGLLVPGGADIDPSLYGEERVEECGKSHLVNDRYDLALIHEAVRQNKPVLAICRGLQAVNVAFGGTLYQDIPTQYETKVKHSSGLASKENYHRVILKEGSYIERLCGRGEILTNTSHHQAIMDLAEGFTVTARCEDGIIEAIECEERNIIALQWHPERMQDEETFRRLFAEFVDKCR